ncbi:MAG: flagellar protein FlgN [Alphaproteobacteria bacterium]|nr:flagellar protein FlgN [Alphaproteobacteria bacterium]
MHKTAETALLALLGEERAALRRGDLADLPDLAARKGALIDDMLSHPQPPRLIDQIARDLQRNAALLAAARDGVAAAQSRLGALRAVRNGLSVYTADGDRTTVARRPGALEHKA